MLIVDTKEDDYKQRIKDLEVFVLNLEQARLKEWTRGNKLEKELKELEDKIGK